MDSGLCPLVIIVTLSVILMGFALLYRYRERLKDRPAYVYIGLITVILFVGVSGPAFPGTSECTGGGYTGVDVDKKPGMIEITVVTTGNVDSVLLAGPNGTRSTRMDSLDSGGRFTLRSNEEVINFLNSPENNITVPTYLGAKTVENFSELPIEYQKAPEGFINPDADIGNYDNASVATVACLHTSVEGFELGGEHIPAGSPIPCSTPFLAQKIDDRWTLGTYTKPTSGPNKDETLVSPVTLKKGEYQIIGTIDGQETVIQSLEVTDRTLRE
jgi:hypothetical protein